MERRYQVFISSTYADLQEERQEIIQALLELDCIPVGAMLFPTGDDGQWALIKKVIDECDYYIVVIGGRYGSLSPSGISYTQMEYEYAVSQGKPVVAFLHQSPNSLPPQKTEDTDWGRRKLAAFRTLVQKRMCRYWTSTAELGSAVTMSLVNLIQTRPAPLKTSYKEEQFVRAFLSYKWEDEVHNKWVEKFATDLRALGIETILDKWEVRLGDSFTDYMTSKINEADVVLFIMTTRAVAAVEAPQGQGGAVKFEMQMAKSRSIAGENIRLIGIYREGAKSAAHLRDNRYADFRDDSQYQVRLKELVDDLLGIDTRPPLQQYIQLIRFYSCFLGYSSRDQDFVERLYRDLTDKGVRCWYAPEDLRAGKNIRVALDEAMYEHDKVLLVLSEHSVTSRWVEIEVENAFEKEMHTQKSILMPIRLDDSVYQINSGWPNHIRKSRQIADFTRWKDHDSYQKAFDRLVRDLKVEESDGLNHKSDAGRSTKGSGSRFVSRDAYGRFFESDDVGRSLGIDAKHKAESSKAFEKAGETTNEEIAASILNRSGHSVSAAFDQDNYREVKSVIVQALNLADASNRREAITLIKALDENLRAEVEAVIMRKGKEM